jgi:hypothetical protein
MPPVPRSTTARTTDEHNREAEARQSGKAYMRYRDGDRFAAVALQPADAPLYIGRHPDCAIHIAADDLVSRAHARLVFGAGSWSIEDRASTNGTRVDGRLVVKELALRDSATIVLSADTTLSFHDPYGHAVGPTQVDTALHGPPLEPSSTQRRILLELARPTFAGEQHPIPPTNAAIGESIGFSAATVRDNISRLYARGGLVRGGDQRQALVELAIRQGLVSAGDYAD